LTIGQEVTELHSNLQEGVRPTRRVVTGNDEHGRSRVVWDGPAPNAIGAPTRAGGGMLDLWVFHQTPAPLSGDEDAGHLPYNFEPPREGAQEVNLRAGDTVIQRGTNHAGSNRSDRPCVIAISSHDGAY
jgi:hypothetical protein